MADRFDEHAEALQKISDDMFPLDGIYEQIHTKESAAKWYEENKKKESAAWAAYLRAEFGNPSTKEKAWDFLELSLNQVISDNKDSYAVEMTKGFLKILELAKKESKQNE